MNQLTAIDPYARAEMRRLNNLVAALAQEVKRLAVTQALDEEALDRIIDNLPPLAEVAAPEETQG